MKPDDVIITDAAVNMMNQLASRKHTSAINAAADQVEEVFGITDGLFDTDTPMSKLMGDSLRTLASRQDYISMSDTDLTALSKLEDLKSAETMPDMLTGLQSMCHEVSKDPALQEGINMMIQLFTNSDLRKTFLEEFHGDPDFRSLIELADQIMENVPDGFPIEEIFRQFLG